MRPIRSPSDTVKETFWNSEVIPYRFASPWALIMGTKSRCAPRLSLEDYCAKPSSFSVIYFDCERPSMVLRSFFKDHIRFSSAMGRNRADPYCGTFKSYVEELLCASGRNRRCSAAQSSSASVEPLT